MDLIFLTAYRLFITIVLSLLFQIIFLQFLMLWIPMFLSSLRLTVANPGFTLGFEPDAQLACCQKVGLSLLDLALFVLHPIILSIRISILQTQQEAIRKNRNLNLSGEYEKNLTAISRLEAQFFSYKKLELNMETIYQITMSILLYLYAISDTTTSNSLKAIFNREDVTIEEGVFTNKTWSQLSFGNFSFTEIAVDNTFWSDIPKFLPHIDPLYAITFNFVMSFISFTRSVSHSSAPLCILNYRTLAIKNRDL